MRDLLRVALPLVISTTAFTALHFCDRLFLAWHTTIEMGAVMNGGAVTWASLALPLGIATYASTFVAQYLGAGQREQLGKILGTTIRLSIYTIPFFLLFGILAPQLFQLFDHEEHLMSLETLYVQLLCFGSPAAILGTALSSLFIGQGRTRIVMIVDIAMALINIVLDYGAIFGKWGLPEGGLEGAAWATVIAMWCKPAMLGWALYADEDRASYHLADAWQMNWKMFGQLLKFGVPNGLQFLQEASSFTLFLMFVGKLGPMATEATTLSININLVAFVPIIGIGIAVTTLVGQQIGRQRADLAERATWNGLWLAGIYAAAFAAVYTLLPEAFMSIYGLNRTTQTELQETALVLLRFVAAYCVLDAVQLVFVSAIKGAGDTWFAMAASVVLTAGFIGLGTIGAQFWETSRQQLMWWWSCLTLWIWLLSVVYFTRFRLGKWKSMSVISGN